MTKNIRKILNEFSLICLCLLLFSISYANDHLVMQSKVSKKLHALELRDHVLIGVSEINIGNGSIINYRANQRFPMDSTFKLMTVAAILKKSKTNPHFLKQRIIFTQKEVASSGYAPIVSKHIKSSMTVSDLCAASLEYSDNAAMNKLMKILGGPDKVTQFARSIGDEKYFLVRREPALNSAIPHDKRDTTTPLAMADSMQKLVLGNALGYSRRTLLQAWLMHCKTGDSRIRAGVPHDFVVADKTGTGDYGSIGDIGVIWRTHGAPVVLVVYVRQNEKNAHTSDKVIAQTTKIVMNAISVLP